MNNNDYVKAASTTDHPDYKTIASRLQDETSLRILHAVMGMVTEAGELMDAVKKYVIYGKPLDMTNLKEECGDTFWYQALLARAAGFTFEEAMKTNIEKLAFRYPERFTEVAALKRDLNGERRILDGVCLYQDENCQGPVVETTGLCEGHSGFLDKHPEGLD